MSAESEKIRDNVRQKMDEIDTWKGKHQRAEAELRGVRGELERVSSGLEARVGELGK